MPELYSIGGQSLPEKVVRVRAKCPNCGTIHEFSIPNHHFRRLSRGARVQEQLSEVGADRLRLLTGGHCGCIDGPREPGESAI
jgi:ribosomal protein S27AE